MSKICTKCKKEKSLDLFGKDKTKKDGLNYWCKSCVKDYYNNNKIEHNQRTIKRYNNNKEEYLDNMKNWYQDNKENHNQNMENWKQDNPNYFKNYYQDNKQARYDYKKLRKLTDHEYRLVCQVRDRINKGLKYNKKQDTTIKLLGCTIKEYKLFFKLLFTPEMSWENHGKIWEIDHIQPICTFNLDLLNEQEKAFHYTNTQPLFKTTKIAESFGYINYIGNRDKKKYLK